MKKLLCLIICVLSALSLCSCSSCEKDDEGGTLAVPVLTISEFGEVSWEAQGGAVGYEYKINDGEPVFVEHTVNKILILSGESICVRALGDGEKYTSSEWSEAITRGLIQLPKPIVTSKEVGEQVLVLWEKNARASGYIIRINDGEEISVEGDSEGYLISKNDTIYVRAKGDGVAFADSDWTIVGAVK